MKTWTCSECGKTFPDLQFGFGMDAPWRAYVPVNEFNRRVILSKDKCLISGDESIFLIRGQIRIPVRETGEEAVFSVWSSLSEKSHSHVTDRWYAPDRAGDALYFGWLCSQIYAYPDTIHLKLSVQSREPGLVPLFTVERSGHPLAEDQANGISLHRWHEIAGQIMERYASRPVPDQVPPGADWKCPCCGELVPDDLGECWNCRTERAI